MKRKFPLFWDNFLNMFCTSVLTGLFSGVVITFYNILMSLGEGVSAEVYSEVLQNPAFIPVLFVGLASGAVLIGVLVRFVPMIRGSGIPQIEGAARGVVRFKWYVTMTSMFAASLACVFMGYPAGAEGPSLEIGGCCGSATGLLLRRNQMVKRLQIASGASAGLAVAFNAPVTGLVFAMEEAFRSFSPQVFICAAVSVASAVLTRNAIRPALGYGVGFSFDNFVFSFNFDGAGLVFCLWVALAALITSLAGVGFYHLVFLAKKLFKKITFFNGAGKYIIPFLIAGAFGLVTLYSLGGGHSFIDDIASGGTGEINIARVFGTGLLVSLIIIVLIRFVTAVLTMACGVPCGVFIPMLAIGAGLGAVMSVLFQGWGMDGGYSDYLIIICMSAFFTCIVKAPVTGIVMVFELTGQFANFLPALIGIAIGYAVGAAFRTEPIYERNLDEFIKAEKLYEKFRKVRLELAVGKNSKADGAAVRKIVWPTNGLVVGVIKENGEETVADGETVLRAGEKIIFECETDDEEELKEYLYSILGE